MPSIRLSSCFCTLEFPVECLWPQGKWTWVRVQRRDGSYFYDLQETYYIIEGEEDEETYD